MNRLTALAALALLTLSTPAAADTYRAVFTVSANHFVSIVAGGTTYPPVEKYILRIYAPGITTTPALTIDLGKPAPDLTTNEITVNIDAQVRTLPPTPDCTASAPEPAKCYTATVSSFTTGTGEAASLPASFVGASTPVQTCAAADRPTIFVTRALAAAPGQLMHVDYVVTSKTPPTRIEAKINGVLAGALEGPDLSQSAGLLIRTPAPGTYKVTVRAVNAIGCDKEVFSLIDLTVK